MQTTTTLPESASSQHSSISSHNDEKKPDDASFIVQSVQIPTSGVAKVELFSKNMTKRQRTALYGAFCVLSFVLSLGIFFLPFFALEFFVAWLCLYRYKINILGIHTYPPQHRSRSKLIPPWLPLTRFELCSNRSCNLRWPKFPMSVPIRGYTLSHAWSKEILIGRD